MAATVSPRATFRDGTNETEAPCWCKHPINVHATDSRVVGCQGGDGTEAHPICGCRWVQRDLEESS